MIGCAFGGIKGDCEFWLYQVMSTNNQILGRSQLPDLVDDYIDRKLKVEECKTQKILCPITFSSHILKCSLHSTSLFANTQSLQRSVITHRKDLAEINEAFEVMKAGDCIRYVHAVFNTRLISSLFFYIPSLILCFFLLQMCCQHAWR